MFFKYTANIANKNVKKYEKQFDKLELKHIMRFINEASHQGYTGIKWRGTIQKRNLDILKKYGYKIINTTCYIYEIQW